MLSNVHTHNATYHHQKSSAPRSRLRRPKPTVAFLIASSLAGATSCSNHMSVGTRSDHVDTAIVVGEVPHLEGTVLLSGDALGLPFRAAAVGPYLVVLEIVPGPAFHVLDWRTGHLIGSFGGAGEGPGEFRSPWSLDVVPGACCKFWLWDVGTSRMTLVDVERLVADPSSLGDSSITLITERAALIPRWLNDHQVVATGLFEEGRLAVFDRNGRITRWIGAIPGDDPIPPHLRQHAYQATLALHPARRLAAIGSRHAGLLEILDLVTGQTSSAQSPFAFEARYDIRSRGGRNGVQLVADTRFGYIDVDATAELIVALYSGRTREEFRSRASLGGSVHLFNWDGTFRGAYHLDAPALSVAVDPTSQFLYAIRHDPQPAVITYVLGTARTH